MDRSKNVTQINLRVSSDVASDLGALAEQAQATRIDLARQVLLEGIASRKRELARRLYREGKASKSRAAEVAGISLWEMMGLIDQAAVPSAYSLGEAVEAVRQIVSQSGAGRSTPFG
jgi:predicted HTH domain antitoxin